MNLLLLCATLLALLSGPLLFGAARQRPAVLAYLDGFVLVAISGLVLLEVMPDTLLGGGPASLGFLLLGALGPSLLEHQLQHARRAHVAALVLAMVGLVLHSVADGTALAPQPGLGDEPNLALALAIAVHSVPVGLMVWWLLYPVFGALFPALAIGGMCLGTITGYAFAGTVGGWLGATGWAWLQALVAGSILHVVFGRPHLGDTSAHRIARPPFEGLGNLSALGALLILETLHPAGHQGHPGMLDRLLDLSRMLAPALLLAWVGGSGWRHATRREPAPRSRIGGALAGLLRAEPDAPLHAHLLRTNAGIPLPGSLAWLAGASLLGLSTALLSLPLLGWRIAVARAGAALVLTLLVGGALGWLFRRTPVRVFRPLPPAAARLTPMAPVAAPLSVPPPPPRSTVRDELLSRVDREAPSLLAGLLIAAIAAPWLSMAPWAALPSWTLVVLSTLLGAVLGRNALAVTPIGAVLLGTGLPPAAVLGLVLAGPLLDPTLLIGLARLHGRNLAAAMAVLGLIGSLGAAFAVQHYGLPLLPAQSPGAGSGSATITNLQTLPLLGVLLLTAHSLLRRGGRQFFGSFLQYASHRHDHDC